MYAIVDIETTGSHASANGITEIAIVIHNGREIVDKFQTLINPKIPIPIYIQSLTGISNEMVSTAATFDHYAKEIYELLHDKIFVAHNVNFDFSFLHYHLAKSGYNLQTKKLCTVRLSRKILPGLPSYSLGKLCSSLGIDILARHRAMGDAEATAVLFSMLLENDQEGHINKTLNPRSKEQSLPPHLPREDMDKLPSVSGIYYFHNSKSKVIYVGKAKNIKKRVSSHFANNKPGKQKQEFLRDVHHISFQECGTELMAFILEAVEIKRLWPAYNRSLKRFEHTYGLYLYEDQNGYLRMAVDKRNKFSKPFYTFNRVLEGHTMIKNLIGEFNLCPKLCFVQKNAEPCISINEQICKQACQQIESPECYNQRVLDAIHNLKASLPGFLLVDDGRNLAEKSCILVENGHFYGMGYVSADEIDQDISNLKKNLTPYPSNDYIRNLIFNHSIQFPFKTRAILD
ncbi:exonuclease domain-containing protein [Daejeonella sp.]|uniref:exonuclease domain-containing protein n=1 Tax=Daejeonella sp. TaxID=2805397 RepID=UPI0025BE6DF6|nr:exonuclease domain-containing protein [Daejeonella sp.]